MSVNQYILNQLYANGIIEYIPDLGQGAVGNFNMQNPYMNMAMSGAGFQNYGLGTDAFTTSGHSSCNTPKIGSQSKAWSNMFGFRGIGSNTNTGISNLYNQGNIGAETNTGISNSLGGFTDVSNNFNNAATKFMNAPDFVKGLAALGIMVVTFLSLKGKRKPKPKQGFFASLNPFKKKVKPEPEKISFWTKINPFKSKSK